MDAELAVHPNTPKILVHNHGESLYLHNNPKHMHSLFTEAMFLERIGANFFIYQNTVAGTEITNDFDVMNCFHIQKIKSPVLTHFA